MTKAMSHDSVKAKLSSIGWTPLEWDHDQYMEIVGSVSKQVSGMGDGLLWEEEQIKKLRAK